MANGKSATWSTIPVETWRKRMGKLREQALEQPVVFIVGSGLSFDRSTKKGVADVSTLVQWIRGEYHVEVPEGSPWQIYQEAIRRLGDEAGPTTVGRLIRRAVLAAYEPTPDARDWVQAAEGPPSSAQQDACQRLELRHESWKLPPGVIGFASFVADLARRRKELSRPGLGPIHIVTTNFDPLIEVALRGFGSAVASRSIPDNSRPQSEACDVCVCHVHGSWWDATLHSPQALEAHRDLLKAELADYLKHAQVCVLGYGGWQDIVSTTIADTMNLLGGRPDVVWAFFEADEEKILEKYREPLERLDGSIGASRVKLYRGVDVHLELPRLAGGIVPNLVEPPEGPPPTGTETAGVPPELIGRLREDVAGLLASAPKSAEPKLRAGPAIVGRGGRGEASAGGRGGDATSGLGETTVGGKEGEAGQVDGRGARGGQTGWDQSGIPTRRLRDARWVHDFGGGGDGGSSPAYQRKYERVAAIAAELGSAPSGPCVPSKIPVHELNEKLRVEGAQFRVRIKAGCYEFVDAPDDPADAGGTRDYVPYPLQLVRELEDCLHERDSATPNQRSRCDQRIRELTAVLAEFRPPRAGDVVAGAELLDEIGSGEFGTVWRAKRKEDGIPCAVKVFHHYRLAQGRMVREFRQGVAAMRALTRAGAPRTVVHLIDNDEAELAFSMTLVDGSDLTNVAQRGWTLDEKLRVFSQLCEAVKFAHDKKVIHRDLKPSNIVIDRDGTAVLTDFDLADLLTLRTLTTRSAGTLAYVAPEQVDDRLGREYGRRLRESDIYSLGRVLFFLLTQSDPGVFDRSTELLGVAEHVGLRRIIRRCVQEDPRKRYRNIDELLADIRRQASDPEAVGLGAQRQTEDHSLEPVPPHRSRRHSKLRQQLLVGVAVSVIGGAFALIAAWIQRPSPTRGHDPPEVRGALSEGDRYGGPSPAASARNAQPAPDRTLTADAAIRRPDPAQIRKSDWLSRGKGSHSRDVGLLPLREPRLALGSDEIQLGSFVCHAEFDERGNPQRLHDCNGTGPARTAKPIQRSVQCMLADDRKAMNCWTLQFSYNVGGESRHGTFVLWLPLR
jgi:serine/threonine protein kinase